MADVSDTDPVLRGVMQEMFDAQGSAAAALRAGLWRGSVASGALVIGKLVARFGDELAPEDREVLIQVGAGLLHARREIDPTLS